ncbi:cobalamin biosynthesis protein CobD [Devosia pacifica]|uniref:Cobalamin biosynthesis protein CobD n=1 Tax=Devosia pacifica TaxID=1335967 RepID=A0A918VWA1_9HYPH|nr:adenosylcobinamide-phosphate synthase CbiB [Devosia pacifica]GHA30780.1 cobalamin biosynthesis protein CobD [Devosia pacifica]
MSLLLAPLALLVERIWGYPDSVMRAIGHPVMWVGALIAMLDRRFNKSSLDPQKRRDRGVVCLAVVLVAVFVPSFAIQQILRAMPFGWVLEAILATAFLAQKELGRAIAAVADGLERSLADGREAVSHVVGRDPQRLDEAGVSRAAVESLAESTSDGVVAPFFWLFIFGLPGIALYKAINTADSMVGHRDERYAEFGWASARLDDLVNLVPARLSAGLIVIAAILMPGASPPRAWQTAQRDASKHQSPNAGWPEAAMAGALGMALGGPRSYDGEMVDLPTMGDGRKTLGPADIRQALTLYRGTLNILLGAALIVALALPAL